MAQALVVSSIETRTRKMGWTEWQILIGNSGYDIYTDDIKYKGAAVYQLGVHTGGLNHVPVYIGHTENLKTRLGTYATSNSHLKELELARQRNRVYCRWWKMKGAAEAKRKEGKLLERDNYLWNKQENQDSDYESYTSVDSDSDYSD